MQDGVHLFRYGHFDVHFLGQANGSVGGEHALGDHAVHAGDDLVEFAAFAEFHADGPVAGKASGAGEDEVAHAGKSGHGFVTRTAGFGQAGDLGQSTGDERGDGVVAEPESVANAGGNGDYVLERAAEFHADDVVVGVNAKGVVAEFALHQRGKVGVF